MPINHVFSLNPTELPDSRTAKAGATGTMADPDAHPDSRRQKHSPSTLPIAFFGTSGVFSHRVFKQFVAADVDIRAIFCHSLKPFRPELAFDIQKLDAPTNLRWEDKQRDRKVASQPWDEPLNKPWEESNEIELHINSAPPRSTIFDIGWNKEIPVYSIGRLRSAAVTKTLEALNVAVVCVACFNQKIPSSLLRIPEYGFLNLHPSLLPAYRGPDPLQWILHDGAQGGVTVHWMDEEWDTGDIALQREVDLAPQMNYFAAERLCADAGGAVYLDVLAELAKGNVLRSPQGKGGFYRGRLGSGG